MKRFLVSFSFVLLLCLLAGCSDSNQEWDPVQATTEPPAQNTTTITEPTTEPTTASTSSSVAESTTEATPEPTTEPSTESAITSDGSKVSLYYNAVVDAAAELRVQKNFGESIFYDIDLNGVEEWIRMYTDINENHGCLFVCDVYTLVDNVVTPLLLKEPVFYNNAGGPAGSVGIAELDGVRCFYIQYSYADWKDHEGEALPESLGGWKFYSMDGSSLNLKTEIIYELVQNNHNTSMDAVQILRKPENYEAAFVSELSHITMNGELMSMEEYGLWLDILSILQDVDGIEEEWELEEVLSPEELLEFYNQKLFVDQLKLEHDLEQVQQLQTQWQGYKGIGDSAAFLAREWTETEQGIRINSAILHEDPLNRAQGMDGAETLAEKVAAQYGYWEETGRRDYIHTDRETPPGHRVQYIAINASNTHVKFRLFINGMDYGIHELYQQVFLYEPDTEFVIAKEPAVVELQVLEGQLPGEEYIFVYLDSNISAAR